MTLRHGNDCPASSTACGVANTGAVKPGAEGPQPIGWWVCAASYSLVLPLPHAPTEACCRALRSPPSDICRKSPGRSRLLQRKTSRRFADLPEAHPKRVLDRSTSRTLRIDNLSAGIGNPALLQGSLITPIRSSTGTPFSPPSSAVRNASDFAFMGGGTDGGLFTACGGSRGAGPIVAASESLPPARNLIFTIRDHALDGIGRLLEFAYRATSAKAGPCCVRSHLHHLQSVRNNPFQI